MEGRTIDVPSQPPRGDAQAQSLRRTEEPRPPRRVELDPDEERAPEEAGYGYGV